MTAHGIRPRTNQRPTAIADALSGAEDACAQRKLNLTPVRRRVLESCSAAKALGAYDILSGA